MNNRGHLNLGNAKQREIIKETNHTKHCRSHNRFTSLAGGLGRRFRIGRSLDGQGGPVLVVIIFIIARGVHCTSTATVLIPTSTAFLDEFLVAGVYTLVSMLVVRRFVKPWITYL